jgi:hypothetical protein
MSESRSELFQLGFDVLDRKHELNRATTFCEWTQKIIPLLGFDEIRVNLGYIEKDSRGWPLFGVNWIISTLNGKDSELLFRFEKNESTHNLMGYTIEFIKDEGSKDLELLVLWLKVLFMSTDSFKRVGFGSFSVTEKGSCIGFIH